MIVPDEVRKCAAFIAIELASGERRFIGTAFWLARTIEGAGGAFGYAVTAAHVIDQVQALGIDKVLIRVNFRAGGARWLETSVGEWFMHPTDPTNDVAVWRGGPELEADALSIRVDQVLREADFASEQVGIGTEIFLTGLFVNHSGADLNEPIIRVGNLSALPIDPIATRRGPMRGFLVEARSIGGLSGSPVFANLGQMRVHDGRVQFNPVPHVKLIGLMHGHFEMKDIAIDVAEEDVAGKGIHSGIGVVVPVRAILETIEHPAIAEAEERFLRDHGG